MFRNFFGEVRTHLVTEGYHVEPKTVYVVKNVTIGTSCTLQAKKDEVQAPEDQETGNQRLSRKIQSMLCGKGPPTNGRTGLL